MNSTYIIIFIIFFICLCIIGSLCRALIKEQKNKLKYRQKIENALKIYSDMYEDKERFIDYSTGGTIESQNIFCMNYTNNLGKLRDTLAIIINEDNYVE